ncbi:MAG: aminotransferase class V-fold PLP-dependent enzyme [Gemmatimonadetes bacterium]|nr:aminotransferase class V-fold PLP-dependent enzyme [Gemmatimonadota bacterium]
MSLRRREFVSAAASLAGYPAVPVGSRPTDSDPLGVRPDFPILENGRTYLNSAYITPSPRSVLAAGIAFAEAKSTRPMTVAELLARANEVRAQFARLINATSEEIGLVFATSEGENIMANTVPMGPGDNVVVDSLHYEGALVAHRQLERRRGVELRIVEHRDGLVSTADIARRVDRRTRLISVSYVSSINGLRHDVRGLADLAHAHGALLHVDAIQALGMFPVDVRADQVDSLCAGTYKFLLGGFGVAPFYLRRDLHDRLDPDRFGIFGVESQTADHRFQVRRNARRYDYATLPFAEVHQLGAGLGYLERVGVDRIDRHCEGLVRRLEAGLLDQGHRLFTPRGNRSSILCFHTGRTAAEVRAIFEAARLDATVREGHVRLSLALFNNAEDVERALDLTKSLAR